MIFTCLFLAALLQSEVPPEKIDHDWNLITVIGERSVDEDLTFPTEETYGNPKRIDVKLSLVCEKLFLDGTVREIPVRDNSVLFTCDPIKVYLRTDSDCYIYIFLLNSIGQVELLYPDHVGHVDRFHRGMEYCLPGKSVQWILDDAPGRETLYFLATMEVLGDRDIMRVIPKMKCSETDDYTGYISKRGVRIVQLKTNDHKRLNQQINLHEILSRYGNVIKQVEIIHR